MKSELGFSVRSVVALVSAVVFVRTAGAKQVEIPDAGGGREAAKVYVPQTQNGEALPVILLLHGYTGSGDIMDAYFGLSARVDAKKFILIVPNGKKDSHGFRYWNATDACCDFDRSSSDDVGYLLRLIDQVALKYRVDRSRIFAAGHSNGAFMAHRLACEPSSPVSAIVSLAGATYADASKCHATHPVSLLQIHAIDDDTILYDGGPNGVGGGLAPYPSVAESISRYAALDGCRSAAKKVGDLDLSSSIPGTDSEHFALQGCAAGTRVEQWKIRAYKSTLHMPHSPMLNDAFTDGVLGFLLR